MRALTPAVLLAAALVAVAPASAAKPKLSEIAEKARKPPAEQKKTSEGLSQAKVKQPVAYLPAPTSPPPAPAHHDHVGFPALPPPPPTLPLPVGYVIVPDFRYEDEWYGVPAEPVVRGRLGLVGGGGGVRTDAMDAYGAGGLLLGLESRGWSLDVRGWRSSAAFGRELTDAFRDLRSWSGDLVLGAPLARLAGGPVLRLLAGARAGRLEWKFRNPVVLDDGARSLWIARDTLGFAALFAGLELEMFRGSDWSLGTSFAVGRQGFANDTGEGFENDLFESGLLAEGTVQVVFFPTAGRR